MNVDSVIVLIKLTLMGNCCYLKRLYDPFFMRVGSLNPSYNDINRVNELRHRCLVWGYLRNIYQKPAHYYPAQSRLKEL